MRYSQNDVIGLAILKDIEALRVKIASGEMQAGGPDWAIRICQASVAKYTQFQSRADWVKELKKEVSP